MPWIMKHTRSDRPMVAEYICPVHGRFALEVQRDANGDPPAEVKCQQLLSLREAFSHPTKGLRWASPGAPCGELSPFAISKPGFAKVKAVEAVRGSYQKAERETWTNTESLGEGQSLEDWEDDRAKVWERHREAEVHQMMKEL